MQGIYEHPQFPPNASLFLAMNLVHKDHVIQEDSKTVDHKPPQKKRVEMKFPHPVTETDSSIVFNLTEANFKGDT